MTKTGASLARHRSEQTVVTPPDFMDAVVRRFGPIDFDLAASSENTQAPEFFSEPENALAQDWTRLDGTLWLNCPFSKIAPWAAKCAVSVGPSRRILLLTPASVGSEWFSLHVHRKAFVLALSPRIRFVGHEHAFPKDLLLNVFTTDGHGFDTWRWNGG